MSDEREKISLVGAELPCKHGSCGKCAISLSDYCWAHTEDKEGYKRRIEAWARTGRPLDQFYLSGAVLRGANLQRTRLRGVNFQGANLVGAVLRGTDLLRANLREAQMRAADLRGANLRGANLQGADLGGANLQGAFLLAADLKDAKSVMARRLRPGIGEEKRRWFRSAREAYLNLKTHFHSTGRHRDERWAFLKEREMERRRLFMVGFYGTEELSEALEQSRRRRWLHWLTHYSQHWREEIQYCFAEVANLACGYGEQPWKVLVSAAVVMSLFAGIYFLSGEMWLPKHYWLPSDSSVFFGSPIPIRRPSLWRSLWFSVVTFTTLGFGDWRPNPFSWVRYVVMAEAFIGAFMMALFVFTFGKSVARRQWSLLRSWTR